MTDESAIIPFKIGTIIVISVMALVEIIILIRWLYIKLNYTKKTSAKVINKFTGGGSSYSQSDFQSSYAPLSKGDSTYYVLAYTIDGVDYKATLQNLSYHTKKGDIVNVKYHKKDYNKIVDSEFNWSPFIFIGLFMLAWVLVLIFVLNLEQNLI